MISVVLMSYKIQAKYKNVVAESICVNIVQRLRKKCIAAKAYCGDKPRNTYISKKA